MKKIILVFVSTFYLSSSFCQIPQMPNKFIPKFTLGAGGGIDFGGFGTRVGLLVSDKFKIFGALGYNLLETDYNFGLLFRIAPSSQVCPYMGAMYGYNAVIKIKGDPENSHTYYGLSWTIGTEYWLKRKPQFFSLGLILPWKSIKFRDDYLALSHSSNIVTYNNVLPVGISIGYHFLFQ